MTQWWTDVLGDVEILNKTARSMAHVIRKLVPVALYDCRTALDTTPGRGGFWAWDEPVPWRIVSSIHDFRALPFAAQSWDAVFYDPPHAAGLGQASYFKDRYGTYKASELPGVICQGASECWRITRKALIAKCTDHVNSARYQRQSGWIIDAVGQEPYQVVIVVRGPVGSRRWKGFNGNVDEEPPQSARSVSSTLLVFRRGSQEHSAQARERRLRMA